MDYQYSYLYGAIVFVAAWMVCWIWQRNRRPLYWGTLVAAPFALTGIFFVPEYWAPPSIWYWLPNGKMCFEDWLWSAAIGGVGAVASDLLFEGRVAEARRRTASESSAQRIYWDRWIPLLVVVVVFLGLECLFPSSSIYSMSAAFFVGAVVTCVRRRDLVWQVVRGGFVFALVYLFLFVLILLRYPEFVTRYWSLQNLWGPAIMGIPIEELLFAATGGAVWSVGYEVTHGFDWRAAKGSLVSIFQPS